MHRHPSRRLCSAFHGPRVRLIGLALLFGCGGAAKPAPVTPNDVQRTDVESGRPAVHRPGTVEVHSDAEATPLECKPGSGELCNAIDDDCNGIIDDGCGYDAGGVQITVSWDSGADIDLYVTDPSGATVYYNEQHDRSALGGHLDHNARGNCRREQQNPRIENAFWPSPAPIGSYRVELHYFSPCDQGAVTEVLLSLAVRQKVIGTYRFQLEPEERIEALSFDVY
jgi:tRNA (guanosine-2'-O-)-methyltransferase